MLDLIRKKQKTIIIKVVFWAIIATFVGTIFLVWGKGSDGGDQDTTVAATVNKTRIDFDAYQSAYSNLYRLYQNIYKEQFTPELEKQLRLRQQALDTLVEQTLLLEEAERMDISVKQKELVEAIAAIPAFQENGVFSKERYLQVLNYQRLTPEGFETMQRRQLLIERVRERIQGDVTIGDADIAEEHRRQNEKVDLAFVRLAPAQFEGKVKIDEKALTDFFTAHKEEFRRPESIALRYLLFEPARFEKAVVVEEGDLEKYYRRHLDRFDTGTDVKKFSEVSDQVKDQVKAGVRKEKSRLLAYEKAMDAYNMHRKGGDLDAAAKANGLEVNETAFFSRQEPIEALGDLPELSATAFTLKEGELARPEELPQGVILYSVKARRESRLPELAEVRSAAEQAFRREQAKTLAREAAEKLLAAVKAGEKLEVLAEKVEHTGLFSRSYGAFVPRLGNAENLATTAFDLSKESPVAPEVYDIDGTFVVAVLAERQEADPAALTPSKKDELRESLLTRKQEEALASHLKNLREKAEISIAPTLLSSLEGK